MQALYSPKGTQGPPTGDSGLGNRLLILLQGRKMTPWAEAVGLSAAMGHRLTKGTIPHAESLVPVVWIERVSISWLLDGAGTPFMVLPAASDEDAAHLLSMLLGDEPNQTVTLVGSERGAGVVVVLTQPAQVSRGDTTLDYTAVQVVSGPIDTLAARAIGEHAHGHTKILTLPPDQLAALATGKMGNVPLVGWARAPGGLLDQAEPITRDMLPELTQRFSRQSEPKPVTYEMLSPDANVRGFVTTSSGRTYFGVADKPDHSPKPDDATTLAALAILRRLTPDTRRVVLAMLRGLGSEL